MYRDKKWWFINNDGSNKAQLMYKDKFDCIVYIDIRTQSIYWCFDSQLGYDLVWSMLRFTSELISDRLHPSNIDSIIDSVIIN